MLEDGTIVSQMAGVDVKKGGGGLSSVASILALVKKAMSRGKMRDMGSFENVPKKRLWEQYGSYFGSKEEARQFYKENHQKRKEGKLQR